MDRKSEGHLEPAGFRENPVPGTLDAVLHAAAGKPGPDPAGIPDLTDEEIDRFHQLISE